MHTSRDSGSMSFNIPRKEFWLDRRLKRDIICKKGVKKAWGRLPKKPITTMENFERQEYLTKIHDPSINPRTKSALNEKILKGLKPEKDIDLEPHDEDWVESTTADLMIGPQPLLGDPLLASFGKPLDMINDKNAGHEQSSSNKSGIMPEIKAETTGQRDLHRHYFDEKRATLLEKQEQRAKKENKILSDFRELIHRKSLEKKKY